MVEGVFGDRDAAFELDKVGVRDVGGGLVGEAQRLGRLQGGLVARERRIFAFAVEQRAPESLERLMDVFRPAESFLVILRFERLLDVMRPSSGMTSTGTRLYYR
ncbi:hypothetical protein [Rhizobium leguminosarum]|uniref:hypothetical protein n=1 Tax=Rhizobium leguminosarum TaxID=384 RepID=UPI001FE16879|nr:hypothetical protein [Rhizobium leguminosarum]